MEPTSIFFPRIGYQSYPIDASAYSIMLSLYQSLPYCPLVAFIKRVCSNHIPEDVLLPPFIRNGRLVRYPGGWFYERIQAVYYLLKDLSYKGQLKGTDNVSAHL
jgi:hypothetical protein